MRRRKKEDRESNLNGKQALWEFPAERIVKLGKLVIRKGP
jgi:hypothetical protein